MLDISLMAAVAVVRCTMQAARRIRRLERRAVRQLARGQLYSAIVQQAMSALQHDVAVTCMVRGWRGAAMLLDRRAFRQCSATTLTVGDRWTKRSLACEAAASRLKRFS